MWARISREQFMQRAAAEFEKDWSTETPFWKRDTGASEPPQSERPHNTALQRTRYARR